ncbi:MAG: sigma-70 family RNA polymerase sigma factor [Gemmatimonadota bacterium]|nr:MAG: sigma-70 family RNA polymerase sigma factor [Gemmatimonadota bacterium]
MRAHESELSDGALVRAVLDGDTEAFAVLVRRHQDSLYRHAARMIGRPDEATDVVQSALIKGFESLRRCRDPDRVGAWLFRINANQCKDYLKNRRRRELRLDDAAPLASGRSNPEETAERGRLRQRIAAALERLSADEREAFLLKHVEGRSYSEMAELLGASVPALKMRVHRAREELQELLEDYR